MARRERPSTRASPRLSHGLSLEETGPCRYASAVTSPATAVELQALLRKYRVIIGLRDAADGEPAPALRALAREFPGSLRELDGLTLDQINARKDALERALAGAEQEPWMELMSRYHRLTRAALEVKRGLRGERAPSADVCRELCARWLAECGEPCAPELIAIIAAPPFGRLNAVLLARLATPDRPEAAIELALFGRATGAEARECAAASAAQ